MIEGYCTTWTFVKEREGIRRHAGIPLSAAPGDVVQFHMSSDTSYNVTYIRLRSKADVFNPIPMGEPFSVSAGVQEMPSSEPWVGCNWSPSFTLIVPNSWTSGSYAAHCTETTGEDFYVVFIIKPNSTLRASYPEQRQRFAVLASTNTWNAYNAWGGRSNYTDPNAVGLSFERPNPQTRPAPPYADGTVADPLARNSYDVSSRHLTRAELWISTWLEDSGYSFDTFADADFHAWSFDPTNYAGMILSTHPEYWSKQMRDRLDAYLGAGGKLIYLGGNGLYERVEYTTDLRVMLLRQGDAENAERWLFRSQGRPERAVLCVATEPESDRADVTGYRTRAPGHRFLRDTGLVYDQAFGEVGLTGTDTTATNGKACGWEMDTAKSDLGTGEPPLGCIVLAESTGHPYASQMVTHDTSDGLVFSVGSIIFGGSLVLDPVLQRVLRNVLDECLSRRLGLHMGLDRSAMLGILRANVTPNPVPPRGPLRDIWLLLATHALTEHLSSEDDRTQVREGTLRLIARIAERAVEHETEQHGSAPELDHTRLPSPRS